MNVIVVNPLAKRLRSNTRIRERIHKLFGDVAHIIDANERHHVISELDHLRRNASEPLDVIYVAGGDGTFNHVLNWIIDLPSHERPSIISVGGGQFCYMTRFHGLTSKDPIKNLKRIFSGKLTLRQEEWESLCVEDSLTHKKRHAAFVATGVVSDILEWYEDAGKGGILTVFRLIFLAGLSVTSDWLRRKIGRIHLLEGKVMLGSFLKKENPYAGVALSAIPELLSSCRPFKGHRLPYHFYAMTYWGGLCRLALAAPFIWFGHDTPWTRHHTFNAPVRSVHMDTTDPRLVLDGDLFVWPGSTKHSRFLRTIKVTSGEEVPILVVEV